MGEKLVKPRTGPAQTAQETPKDGVLLREIMRKVKPSGQEGPEALDRSKGHRRRTTPPSIIAKSEGRAKAAPDVIGRGMARTGRSTAPKRTGSAPPRPRSPPQAPPVPDAPAERIRRMAHFCETREGRDAPRDAPARRRRAMGRIEHALLVGELSARPNRAKTFARDPTVPQKVTNVSICGEGQKPRGASALP